jgi:hypothetical protein
MRFLQKPDEEPAVFAGLEYGRDSVAIRTQPSAVQRGFCAYSEKRLQPLDAVDEEHFDPGCKHTAQDGFRNWYATVHIINARKARKIDRFLPLPDPGAPDVQSRIRFEDGQELIEEMHAGADRAQAELL